MGEISNSAREKSSHNYIARASDQYKEGTWELSFFLSDSAQTWGSTQSSVVQIERKKTELSYVRESCADVPKTTIRPALISSTDGWVGLSRFRAWRRENYARLTSVFRPPSENVYLVKDKSTHSTQRRPCLEQNRIPTPGLPLRVRLLPVGQRILLFFQNPQDLGCPLPKVLQVCK